LALTARRQFDGAESELTALRALRADPRMASVTIWDLNAATALLDIAIDVSNGELAAARGDYARAITQLQSAVDREDALTYDEPPIWHVPVRQRLGPVLLASGRPAQAEAVFRRDLQRHPENGWSLYGLVGSLRAQKKAVAAAQVERRFERAWSTADVSQRIQQGIER
jgi:tetratricopeptide (TPR) repeat protein